MKGVGVTVEDLGREPVRGPVREPVREPVRRPLPSVLLGRLHRTTPVNVESSLVGWPTWWSARESECESEREPERGPAPPGRKVALPESG